MKRFMKRFAQNITITSLVGIIIIYGSIGFAWAVIVIGEYFNIDITSGFAYLVGLLVMVVAAAEAICNGNDNK
jgi:hypothetical protein